MLLFNLFLNATFSMVALYIFNRTNYDTNKRSFFNFLVYIIYKMSLVVLALVPITSCLIKIKFFYVIMYVAILNLILISIMLTVKKIRTKN